MPEGVAYCILLAAEKSLDSTPDSPPRDRRVSAQRAGRHLAGYHPVPLARASGFRVTAIHGLADRLDSDWLDHAAGAGLLRK